MNIKFMKLLYSLTSNFTIIKKLFIGASALMLAFAVNQTAADTNSVRYKLLKN